MWKNKQNILLHKTSVCKLVVTASLALLVTACATAPPKPPIVDGKQRVPVNNTQTIAALARRAGVKDVGDQVVMLDVALIGRFAVTQEQKTQLIPAAIRASSVRIISPFDSAPKSTLGETVAIGRGEQVRKYLLENGVDTRNVVVETPAYQGKIPAKSSIPVEVHIVRLVDAVYPTQDSSSWDIHGK